MKKPALRTVTFRADEETLAALSQLEAVIDGALTDRRGGRRSIAVRKAILEAAKRLKNG